MRMRRLGVVSCWTNNHNSFQSLFATKQKKRLARLAEMMRPLEQSLLSSDRLVEAHLPNRNHPNRLLRLTSIKALAPPSDSLKSWLIDCPSAQTTTTTVQRHRSRPPAEKQMVTSLIASSHVLMVRRRAINEREVGHIDLGCGGSSCQSGVISPVFSSWWIRYV